MIGIADHFAGFAEHRMPSEGAEIIVRTGRPGPPLLLYGQTQPRVCSHKIVCAAVRLHALCEAIDRELDAAVLTAASKTTCPTVVLWGGGGSACQAGAGTKQIEAWHARCTKVSAAAVRAGHFLAEENAQATPAALLRAHAVSD